MQIPINAIKFLIFCFIVIGFQSCTQTGRVKKALKAIKKEKIEKAEKLLSKSLYKDSINAGANYGFSLLFVNDNYESYNIDAAHEHINLAIQQHQNLEQDAKTLKKLGRFGIVDSTLHNQKADVQRLAFEHVQQTNTIDGFDYFISTYVDASQVPEAIRLRNEIAYENAREKNTYDAYKYFIDTYPEAIQIAEASELYEFLLYEKKTASRRLESYIRFIEEYPNTNYTTDALDNIFELYTIDNKAESYSRFIKEFPQSKVVSEKAKKFLFHRVKENQGADAFAIQYPEFLNDSLRSIIDLNQKGLFPIVENGLYGFKESTGKVVIRPQYESINEDYLCGEIPADFLEVFENGKQVLLSYSGGVISEDNFGNIEPLKQGLINTQKAGNHGIFHIAGYPVTSTTYDTIALLDNQYIKYGIDDKWGLLSVAGRKITNAQYDDIFADGEFTIFEKNNRFGIANDKLLFNFANEGRDEVPFLYEDYELLNNNEILALIGDEQTVLDKDLEILIPLQKQNIYKLKEGWLINNDNKFRFHSDGMLPVYTEGYDSAFYKGNWLALLKDNKWALLDQRTNTFPAFQYDSLKLLGDFFALGKISNSTYLISQNQQRKLLPKADNFRVISAMNQKDYSGTEVFVVNNSNNYKILFNQHGKQILNGVYSDVSMLGTKFIVLDKYNRKGMADTTGNILLPVIYDGIGNYSEDYIITLRNQKFGMFHQEQKIDISPQYDVILKSYNDSIYIASKNRSLGLIDKTNTEVLPFKFDEIKVWNDSLALVKLSSQWHLYSIKTKLPILEGIVDIKFVGNSESKKEKRAIILKENSYGVITSDSINFLPPVYDDIYVLGNELNPIFFAEKRVKEAGLYVVIYYNKKGEAIHKQTFTEETYDQIYCN